MYTIRDILLLFVIFFCFEISQISSVELRASASISSSRTINSFICPKQFGYYPDDTDCEKYYVCSFGLPIHKNCTHGLYFSQQLQNCDWPLNVLCENDFISDKKSESGYSVVDDTDDKVRQIIKPYKNDNQPVIEIKPLRINDNNHKESRNIRERLPTIHIDTYEPESSSTEKYDFSDTEYTIGSDTEESGPKPNVNLFYSVENFNNTDSRTNYNLDSIYSPISSTVSSLIVDGFNVPLIQTTSSREENIKYETTQSPITRSVANNRNTVRPIVAPQQTPLISSISNRNTYTSETDFPKDFSDVVNERNDKNNGNNNGNSDGVSNVRIGNSREPNYYHYEDAGSSAHSVVGNRVRNNYDLPPIEKPLKVNRSEFINSRSNTNIRNNNNDYVTATSNRLITPTEYYKQLYSNAANSESTTLAPLLPNYGENQLRSSINRPSYSLPEIQSTNEKPINKTEEIYVFVKPLKDSHLIQRLNHLRNSESVRTPLSENPYNTPIRSIAPVVRVIRKQKPKIPEMINFGSIPRTNSYTPSSKPRVISVAENTPKTTTESSSVYQRQRLGQQNYFKQNRDSRVLNRVQDLVSNQDIINNQRDVNRPETNGNNRHTFNDNNNNRQLNRELKLENSHKEYVKPEILSNYKPIETTRPESIASQTQREPKRTELISNYKEVEPELSKNYPNKPESTQNVGHRVLTRPESVQNYNQRDANRHELNHNNREIHRQESKPNPYQREVIPVEIMTEKPQILRKKPTNNKPKLSPYEPEVMPPYELNVQNRPQERPVVIPNNDKDINRDAVVIDYSEINNREGSYLDFLGFANSPKLNPNGIRIIEMPLTTKKPSLRYEWNSNYRNDNFRKQLAKNDTIPNNLKFQPEDAVNLVVQTPNPFSYRDGNDGRTSPVYKPTFRPDIKPSPGYSGDSRHRPSRPTTTERPLQTTALRPQSLSLTREQPSLPIPSYRQTSTPVLNRVEVITTRPKPPTLPASQYLRKTQRPKIYRPLITIEDIDSKPTARGLQNGNQNQILSDDLPIIPTNIRNINDLRKNYSEINNNYLSIPPRDDFSYPYTTQEPVYTTSYPKPTRKSFRYLSNAQKPTSTTTTTTTTTTTRPPTTAPNYDYYYEDITDNKNSVTLPPVRREKTTTSTPRIKYRYKTTTTQKPIDYEYDYDYHNNNFSISDSRDSITTTVRAYKTTTTQRPLITRPSLLGSGQKPRPTNRRLVVKDKTREPQKPASRPKPIHPTPNALTNAQKCDKKCKLPDCRCGGSDIPGGLSSKNIPQIVLITFDDAVNDLNWEIYEDIFEKRHNPNGCPIRGTLYVSHEWTDYGQVQTLYSKGHEIASHGITHSFGEKFSKNEWIKEINGQREILHLYGGVKLEDIRGMRAPFLQTGGNRMFEMLYETNFTYDSSLPVFENSPPFWPYTLDYALNHECMIPPCPTKSFPGVWEVGMIMWQDLRGGRCSMGDACTNPMDEIGVYDMLLKNFNRHYKSNRAPFNLYYHSAWFNTQHHKKGFMKFLDEIIQKDDVYFITNWQMIQWVRNPTPLENILDFEPWMCSQKSDNENPCNHPTVCNVNSKNGARSLRTCQPCPQTYPWVGNTGFASSKYG